MSYLDRSGNYYEGAPKEFGGAIRCMKRPEGNYKLIPNPLSDPLHCWEPKAQADLDDEALVSTSRKWRDDPDNDTLCMLLYLTDARLRVLENKPTIDHATFWNQLKTVRLNQKFFDGSF